MANFLGELLKNSSLIAKELVYSNPRLEEVYVGLPPDEPNRYAVPIDLYCEIDIATYLVLVAPNRQEIADIVYTAILSGVARLRKEFPDTPVYIVDNLGILRQNVVEDTLAIRFSAFRWVEGRRYATKHKFIPKVKMIARYLYSNRRRTPLPEQEMEQVIAEHGGMSACGMVFPARKEYLEKRMIYLDAKMAGEYVPEPIWVRRIIPFSELSLEAFNRMLKVVYGAS